MATTSASSSANIGSDLPKKYQLVRHLGEGGYGIVLECLKKGSTETVAVKMPKFKHDSKEIVTMKKMMGLNFDQQNIVKFYESFSTTFGKAMVFESLDMSLQEYLKRTRCVPMQLKHIRTVVQQMATALTALKSIGIIHTDLKMDNIMLVDQCSEPFKLKLIDFGLAIHRSDVTPDMTVQPLSYRAPEVFLGLPFTEAIDMWSLGCLMVSMISGHRLFRADTEWDAMQCIVEILGQPANHLLQNGEHTKWYFKRTDSNDWNLKKQTEVRGSGHPRRFRKNIFKSLDHLKRMRLKRDNKSEDVELDQCIELLKAMLKVNPNERITPEEVLKHPFITNCLDSKEAPASAQELSPESSNSPATDLKAPSSLPPRPTNKIFVSKPPATSLKNTATTKIQPNQRRKAASVIPCVIKALPAANQDNWRIDGVKSWETGMKSMARPLPLPPMGKTTKTVVINVQPATSDRKTELDDKESSVSSQVEQDTTSESSVTESDIPKICTLRDSPPRDDVGPKKKRKKRCARRFFNWMKTFFCCANPNIVDVVGEEYSSAEDFSA